MNFDTRVLDTLKNFEEFGTKAKYLAFTETQLTVDHGYGASTETRLDVTAIKGDEELKAWISFIKQYNPSKSFKIVKIENVSIKTTFEIEVTQ